MNTIRQVQYRYSKALIIAANKITPRTVADAEQTKGMAVAENVIIAMDVLYKYAMEHKGRYGSTLNEDSFLGPYWLQAIQGVRGLLNGAGYFDGGALEEVFWRALEVAGFEESDL